MHLALLYHWATRQLPISCLQGLCRVNQCRTFAHHVIPLTWLKHWLYKHHEFILAGIEPAFSIAAYKSNDSSFQGYMKSSWCLCFTYVLLVSKLRSAQQRTPCTFPYKTTLPNFIRPYRRWLLSHFREYADTRTTASSPCSSHLSAQVFSQSILAGCSALLYGKMDLLGLEPRTGRLWGDCSNQLS